MSKLKLRCNITLSVIATIAMMIVLPACDATFTPTVLPITPTQSTPPVEPTPIRVELIETLSGFTDNATSVLFSPDGMVLAVGSQDGIVRTWSVEDWTLLHTYGDRSNHVQGIDFTPDGQVLGIYTVYGIQLWRVADEVLLREIAFSTNEGVSFAFSPDGNLIASGTFPGQVKIYRLIDDSNFLYRLVYTLEGHKSPVDQVVFSPDGQFLASSAVGDEVRLWRMSDGVFLRTLGPGARSVAFSPNGEVLASGNMSSEPVRLWQVSNGTTLYTLDMSMWNLAFSPDGALLIGQRNSNVAAIWNVQDRTHWCTFNTTSETFETLALSPDGTLLALGMYNGNVQIWQVHR